MLGKGVYSEASGLFSILWSHPLSPCRLRIRQVPHAHNRARIQGAATVSSEPSIVHHPIAELLHHLNYAHAVSDFILIYLAFSLWYGK
jgi:hypothetical protein